MKAIACLFLLVLASAASQEKSGAAAEQSQKPACNARNNGEFWPQQANGNHAAFQRFYQSGELEMCTLVVWKYKWQYLSVNIHKANTPRSRD